MCRWGIGSYYFSVQLTKKRSVYGLELRKFVKLLEEQRGEGERWVRDRRVTGTVQRSQCTAVLTHPRAVADIWWLRQRHHSYSPPTHLLCVRYSCTPGIGEWNSRQAGQTQGEQGWGGGAGFIPLSCPCGERAVCSLDCVRVSQKT